MNKRIVCLNAVSTFPWCLGKRGLYNTWDIAKKSGFDGLQGLPLRGWYSSKIYVPRTTLRFIEDAWNSGSFYGALLRTLGLTGEEQPTLLDVLLFGTTTEANTTFKSLRRAFPQATFITHKPDKLNPVEIHPEAGMNPQEYTAYTPGLVWDTHHVRRRARNGGPPVTEDWQTFLYKLKSNIKLIHLHPTGDEVTAFMAGKDSELSEMLRLLAISTDSSCPIVLEVKPPLAIKTATIGWLTGARKRIEVYFG